MIKAAVVGVNNIGKSHCQAYRANPGVELVAVCDLIEERAQLASQEFGVKGYTDLQELLNREEVDLVSIATSGQENGGHHYQPAMMAIRAGVDILVEKPLSNDIQEARQMVQEAAEQNVRLFCDLNHRFAPTAYKAKSFVQEGKLGELLFVNMKLTIGNPKEFSPWYHVRALHSHSVDVMRYFAGDVRRVQAFMTKAPGRSIWSTISVNMEFLSGAVGHLTGSYDMSNRHPIEFCEVAGNKGRFVIDNVYEKLTFYPHASDELLVMKNSVMTGLGRFRDTIGSRIQHMVEQIQTGVLPSEIDGSGREALAAQEVVEAAIRSHEEGGRTVEVSQTTS